MTNYSKKNKSEIVQVSIKMPVELYNDVKLLSKNNERTVSDQIRFIIKEYIRIK